jgi:hypothetical protein
MSRVSRAIEKDAKRGFPIIREIISLAKYVIDACKRDPEKRAARKEARERRGCK